MMLAFAYDDGRPLKRKALVLIAGEDATKQVIDGMDYIWEDDDGNTGFTDEYIDKLSGVYGVGEGVKKSDWRKQGALCNV